MKRYLLLLGCLFSVSLFSQSNNTLLFQNSEVDNKVLNLNIASNYNDTYFIIALVKDNTVIGQTENYAKAGSHSYDLRVLKGPNSRVDYIATTLPKDAILKKELVIPDFLEEVDILFAKKVFSPRTINFTASKRFLGYNFTLFTVVGVCLICILLYFLFKKSFLKTVLISVLIGTFLIDTTTIMGQWNIYQQTENKYPYLDPVVHTQKFLEQVRPIIQQGSWTFRGKIRDEYQKLFMKYSLAEINFIPLGITKIPKGTYIITEEQPKENQSVIIAKEGQLFFLLQQQ